MAPGGVENSDEAVGAECHSARLLPCPPLAMIPALRATTCGAGTQIRTRWRSRPNLVVHVIGRPSLAERHRHEISSLSFSATAVDTVQSRRIYVKTCLRRCRPWQSSLHTATPKHQFY